MSFNPNKIAPAILEIFFSIHDPTTLNRQGADVGTQYRSAIFYHNERQKAVAEKIVSELDEEGIWEKPIVTQIEPAGRFYPAEDYHQDYFKNHPEAAYCQAVISPKLNKFRKRWAARLKH